ncbi:nuclear transport factor 2 family protein [Streptomyces flavofungini]|uniref:Nuclear transport factor 2 family protein n=1 Tax=Streptomyces flavofungini TaxID=68200 RepID=A0ABS0XEL0_9ACTN|nr:nuclear transport factor 2 family protein [Streptomyces flavofungini]MBJ3811652.1 nuclear transport factor 2 family protein [Streptomyces flavofungini]
MTQRVELAAVLDRLAIDTLITDYAITVDDGDWDGYRRLFAPDGRADYRSAGGIEGPMSEVADWLTESLRIFAVRQHLIVNRRIRFDVRDQDIGDSARIQADYANPMRLAGKADTADSADRTAEPGGPGAADRPGSTAPDFECGGRYEFTAVRTHNGWRLRQVVVHEKWRRQHWSDPVT